MIGFRSPWPKCLLIIAEREVLIWARPQISVAIRPAAKPTPPCAWVAFSPIWPIMAISAKPIKGSVILKSIAGMASLLISFKLNTIKVIKLQSYWFYQCLITSIYKICLKLDRLFSYFFVVFILFFIIKSTIFFINLKHSMFLAIKVIFFFYQSAILIPFFKCTFSTSFNIMLLFR